jgi:hypothetical protein
MPSRTFPAIFALARGTEAVRGVFIVLPTRLLAFTQGSPSLCSIVIPSFTPCLSFTLQGSIPGLSFTPSGSLLSRLSFTAAWNSVLSRLSFTPGQGQGFLSRLSFTA